MVLFLSDGLPYEKMGKNFHSLLEHELPSIKSIKMGRL